MNISEAIISKVRSFWEINIWSNISTTLECILDFFGLLAPVDEYGLTEYLIVGQFILDNIQRDDTANAWVSCPECGTPVVETYSKVWVPSEEHFRRTYHVTCHGCHSLHAGHFFEEWND